MGWLATLIKFLPTLISILTTLAGLFTAKQAAASYDAINAAAASGLAAGPVSNLFATHVVGQGAGSVALLGLAAYLFFGGQSHISEWHAAAVKMKADTKAEEAQLRAAIEKMKHRSAIIDEVHDLPTGDLARIVTDLGTKIGGAVQRLTNRP